MTSVTIDEISAILRLDSFDDADLDRLEGILEECNDRARGGDPMIADAVYDRLRVLLQTYRPDSELLSALWELPDPSSDSSYDSLIAAHPMMSIETVKAWDSPILARYPRLFTDEPMTFHLSYKIDGHGIRVVYDRGHLVKAYSRARSSAGRDLTKQMQNILGEFSQPLADWSAERGYDLVEIRGEVCLRLDRLDEAREFTPGLKSAFSAVASLLKPSSSPEENRLLDFLAYSLITEGITDFRYKSEEYSALERLGFKVPDWVSVDVEGYSDFFDKISSSVEGMEERYDGFGYFCDGVVLEVDSRDDFLALGSLGSVNLGNLALKVNTWSQGLYTGIVDYIDWRPGRTKLTPVAVLEGDGVVTENGSTVKNVPVYNPAAMLQLDAFPSHPLSFRFGGEAGVVPCFPDGTLLTDEFISNLVSD